MECSTLSLNTFNQDSYSQCPCRKSKNKKHQKCWFGEGGCHESSEMESGSWRDLLPKWGKSSQPCLWG